MEIILAFSFSVWAKPRMFMKPRNTPAWYYKALIQTLVTLNFLFHAIKTNFDHISPAKLQNKSLQLSFLPNPPLLCRFYLLGGPMQEVFWGALFWNYPPPSDAAFGDKLIALKASDLRRLN